MLQDMACFSCFETNDISYLKSGYFENFINSDLNVINDPTVKLFGKVRSTNSCFWTNMQQLFMGIKKSFFSVKNLVIGSTDYIKTRSDVDPYHLRIEIVRTFDIILVNLQQIRTKQFNTMMIHQNTCVENDHFKSLVMQLAREIKNLLLFVGRLSSITGVNNVGNFSASKSSFIFYHYYHLCLDIWFYSVAVLYSLNLLMPLNSVRMFCDFIDQSDVFLQLSTLLVYEFSSLAINRYKNNSMCNDSPFLCPCVREFWIMVINMIDLSSSSSEKFSFWNIYLSTIQIVIKSVSSESANEEFSVDAFSVANISLHDQNLIEAFLWLTAQIAPLYKYNLTGNFCEYEKAKSGYVVAKYLVHNLLSSTPAAGEKCCRNALSYCIPLVKLWEPNGEIILPLTDFYIKKIDATFSVQGSDLNHLSYLFKDSLSWLTYIYKISNCLPLEKESSFDIFLCILNLQLGLDIDHSLWRLLKGRIYSKFFPKKIKEMSEVGLQNSFSLFHIIVLSGQLEIVDKVCEVASLIETMANPRKQMISWKALYVLLFICQEKNLNAEKILALISKFFTSTCLDYANLGRDSMHKSNLMNLILVYIDNMNELFNRNKSLNLSEYHLICTGFSNLLPACGIAEGNYILSIILNMLQRIQKISEANKADLVSNEIEYIRILELVFNNIYPFIENVSVTDTAPSVISDIAGTLTKLLYDFSSSINCTFHNFQKIFIHFACKETVSSHITSQYLSFILEYPYLIDGLKLKIAELDALIFQCWLRCIIYTETKSECIQLLTQKVLQLHLITEVVPDLKTLNFQTDDHVCLSILFFAMIAATFSKSGLQQKTKMANKFQQYFKTYVSLVLSKIRKNKDKPSLTHVYKLTSHLVEHCSPVLHFHVTSERILLQILDQTVYPQIIFPGDKALQKCVSVSIKEYLPNFIQGLFKLDYRKDKSVEREIRDIFMYYISMFPAPSNPLTKLTVDSVCRKPDGLTLDAYNFILDVLKCSLLSNGVEKPISVFEFYYEVFRLTPPACKKEISTVLLSCAMEVYMKQNDSVTQFLKICIKKVLIHLKEKMQFSHSKIIIIPIIQWFIQEKLQWSVARGFSILDIFVECLPQVVSDVVPFLTKSVETHELNRGQGQDMLLRNGLKKIIFKLQEKLNKT